MVVVSSALQAMTWEAALGEGGLELGDVAVVAEIDDFVTGALEHDGDEVLPDIVQIALDRADGDLAPRFAPGGGDEGFEKGQAGLHGAGGDQQFGDVGFVPGETVAHFAHGRNHGLVEKRVDVLLRCDGALDHFGDDVPLALHPPLP
jgi:hypothetical protein